MSYAASYALFNYTLADHSKGLDDYSNLRLVRGFERGLDPKSSEAGFILTHVDMVKMTGGLVAAALKVTDTIEQHGDRNDINDGFREILTTMEKIEASMEGMYTTCRHPLAGQSSPSLNRNVGQLQAGRVPFLPGVYLRHYQPVHVPGRGGLRRRRG